jgi:hypothetical protein
MRNRALCFSALLMISSLGVAAGPAVICQIITPSAGGMVPARQLESIVRRAAAAIVDAPSFGRAVISGALDACSTEKNVDRCVQNVLRANRAAPAEMLIMTAQVSEAGHIDGTAFFVTPDAQWTAVSYQLEPLDANQRPRRGLGERHGHAEWFAPDSTYLLQTAACDVARRLGLSATEKHIRIRAFDHQNGFDDGTIDWRGSAIIR